MLTTTKAALFLAGLVAVGLTPVESPKIERRAVRLECEKPPDGDCKIGKADLAAIVGAAEELMKEAERLRRELEALREKCQKEQGGDQGAWSDQERRT